MDSFFDNLPWMETAASNRLFGEVLDGIKQESAIWIINGPLGSGKTRLLKEFAKAVSSLDCWVATIDASMPNLVSNLADALGETHLPVNLSSLERIILLFKQCHALGRRVVLLIDNAEFLSNELLNDLIRAGEWQTDDLENTSFKSDSENKKESCRINLVLAANKFNNDWLKNVRHCSYLYELLPFTALQTGRFAQYAYTFLGEKIILTGEERTSLHKSSEGYPGRILQNMKVLSTNNKQALGSKRPIGCISSDKMKWAIKMGMVALSLLLVSFLLLKLSNSHIEQKISEHVLTSADQVNSKKNNETLVESEKPKNFLINPKPDEISSNHPVETTSVVEANQGEAQLLDSNSTEAVVIEKNDDADLNSEVNKNSQEIKVASSNSDGGTTQTDKIKVQTQTAKNIREVRTILRTSDSLIRGNMRIAVTEPVENATKLVQQTDLNTNEIQVDAATTMTTQEIDANKSPDNVEATRADVKRSGISATEQTTLQANKNASFYIIQLTSAETKEAVKASLKGLNIPGNPKFANMMIKGKRTWVSYLGPYSSKAQAEKGAKILPNSVQALKPSVFADTHLISSD